jgi:CHASE2 domain-containing sensor protein
VTKNRLSELRKPSLTRFVTSFGIAIHGFWIPAIPAGMTLCVNTYALIEPSLQQ